LALLTNKYAGLRIDVVVKFARPALAFFVKHGEKQSGWAIFGSKRTIDNVMAKPHTRVHGDHAKIASSRPAEASVSDYVEAFRKILPSLSESHLAMLRAHYMAPNRSLTTSELTEAAVASEHIVAASEVEDASELAEAVDEFGGESVLSETIGEDADDLVGDAREDTSLDATNLQYGAIGQALHEQLPAYLKQQERKQKDDTLDYIDTLAEAEDRSGPRDAWVWKMRPEVASALEELELLEGSSR